MTKKILTLLLILISAAMPAAAQKHGDKGGKSHEDMRKEIREFKIKFLAQEMDLKDDQKEQFVKVYNEMADKRRVIMKKAWECESRLRDDKDATEEDYRKASEYMTKSREQGAALEKEYDAKFAKFLSSKQMFRMKAAENEFQKKLEEMRHKKKRK